MPETPLEPDTPTAAPAQAEGEASATQARPERTRRKLDLNQNRRGAFSVLLGTLSKAKTEDKQRNASEAVSLLHSLSLESSLRFDTLLLVCVLTRFIGPEKSVAGEAVICEIGTRDYICAQS